MTSLQKKLLGFTCLAGLAPVLMAASAAAQQVEAVPESSAIEQASEDRIVVTGSRIRRSDFDAPTPVTSFGTADIEAAGTTELSEILLEIPGVSSAVNGSNSQGGVQRAGLDTVDLRNLGSNRTLTLIDGRRAVSNRANINTISLSTIPNGFVERIEVSTGGASAVYGSDAIAGVVNIITESDFEGLELDVRGEINSRGDNERYRIRGRAGSEFGDGRGYALFAASFDDRAGLQFDDRDIFTLPADFDYNTTLGINEFNTIDGDRPASEITSADFVDNDDDLPGGLFEEDLFFDPVTGELRSDFNINENGRNFRIGDTVLIPRERLSIAGKLTYDITDTVEVFGQVIFNNLDTISFREPEEIDDDDEFVFIPDISDPFTLTTVRAGRIPIDNPFAQAFPEIVAAGSSSGIDFDREFTELGQDRNENNRKTIRSAFGMRGDVFDDWAWEISYGYGRYMQDQTRFNDIDIVALSQALDAEEVDGVIQCADPDARAAGCVPVNLFGFNSITPEAADWIRADLDLNATIQQHTVQAFMTGDLFELPAGPVGFAVGGEFRNDKQDLSGNTLSQRGGVSASPVPNFGGSISVFEGFVETTIPVVVDQPLFNSLTVDGSLRVASYDIDNVGTVVSYTAGLQWEPFQDIRFRGQYSRAQRAPDLAELFSPPRGDFDNVTDICNGVTETSTDTDESDLQIVADNCRADPGIAQFFIDNPGGTFETEEDNIAGPNSGNLDLFEETADTFTVGVILTPSFVPGFRLSVDYYNIDISDAIQSLNGEQILEQCFADPGDRSANEFCGDIIRDAEGQLNQVVNRQINLNSLKTSGIDAQIFYDFEIPSVPGDFDFRFNYNHVFENVDSFTNEITGITTTEDIVGVIDDDSFDDRFRATLGWSVGDLRVRWRTSYFGNTIDDRGRVEDFEELIAENPGFETPLFLFNDAEIYHDIYIAYDLEVGGQDLRIYGGVNDIFDNGAPFYPADGDAEAGGSDNFDDNYRFQGASFYLGARLRF